MNSGRGRLAATEVNSGGAGVKCSSRIPTYSSGLRNCGFDGLNRAISVGVTSYSYSRLFPLCDYTNQEIKYKQTFNRCGPIINPSRVCSEGVIERGAQFSER